MQRYISRGLAVAITAIGLGACVDSLAPAAPRATPSSPAYGITVDLGGFDICTPCPPGLVCAAVCQTFPPEEVPEVAVDTTATAETEATIAPAPSAVHTSTSPSGTARR